MRNSLIHLFTGTFFRKSQSWLERIPYVSATTRHKSQKMWQQIVMTKCHYKLSQDIVVGEKNVTSQNVEVADVKGSLSLWYNELIDLSTVHLTDHQLFFLSSFIKVMYLCGMWIRTIVFPSALDCINFKVHSSFKMA